MFHLKVFVQIQILTVSEESTDILINPDTKPVTDLVYPNITQKANPRMLPVPDIIMFHLLLVMLGDWTARLCQPPSGV